MDLPEWLRHLREFTAAEVYRQMEPNALWARCQSGDELAFRVLLGRMGDCVLRCCQKVTPDKHLAEEAFQEAFCDLFRQREKWTSYECACRVTCKAGELHALKLLRGNGRRRAREQQAAVPDEIPPADPESAEEAERMRVAAERALANLPDQYRKPIELKCQGLTHAQIAEQLGCTVGMVNGNVTRGIALLREHARRLGLGVVTVAAVGQSTAVSRELIARTVAAALAAGPATGWGPRLVTTAVVAATVAGVGAVGAWWRPSAPPPDGPGASAVEKPVPTMPESFQDRNRRVFTEVVAPRVKAELQPLALGDGEVVLDPNVEAFDTRLIGRFLLRHRVEGMRPSELTFVYDAHTGRVRIGFAWVQGAVGKELDLDEPIILARRFLGGRDIVVSCDPLRKAVAAFGAFPPDSRSESEWQEREQKLRRAVEPFLGDWALVGNPLCRTRIVLNGPSGNYLVATSGRAQVVWLFDDMPTVRPGEPVSLPWHDGTVRLSADGRQLVCSGGERLERIDPTASK